MKKIYFTLVTLFITVLSFGQGIGDFIITGYQADTPDQISFLTVVDVVESTNISFTDKGWKSDNTWRASEGTALWVVPSGGIAAGTQVILTFNGGSSSSSVGGVVTDTGGFAMSASGDQIFIYKGITLPTSATDANFIAAISMEGTGWQADAISPNTSSLPSIFSSNPGSSVALAEVDNGQYDCSTTTGTIAGLRTEIYDVTNTWDTSNSAITLTDCLVQVGSALVLPIERNEIENFTIYPNPVVDGRLTITTMSNTAKAIHIFDVLGKQVFATELQQNGAINVESLNTGVYILKVVEEGKISTSRLLIE